MKNKKVNDKNTVIKILACILATALLALAVVFENPWLCSPAIILVGAAVMLCD